MAQTVVVVPKAASVVTAPAAIPSVSLRSARTPQPKASLAPKINAALAELNISTRLIMPTKANQDRLEGLINAIGTLIELKRQVDRSEYEIGVLRARKGVTGGGAAVAEVDEGRKRSVSVTSSASARAGGTKRSRR